MSLDNARKLVCAWRKIREIINPIYGDLPIIDLPHLTDRTGASE